MSHPTVEDRPREQYKHALPVGVARPICASIACKREWRQHNCTHFMPAFTRLLPLALHELRSPLFRLEALIQAITHEQ